MAGPLPATFRSQMIFKMEKVLETKLAEKLDIHKTEADEIINAVRESLVECIKEDSQFRWSGIGTFTTKFRAERPGRNPQTGESLVIHSTNVVKFKPHKPLRIAVNS